MEILPKVVESLRALQDLRYGLVTVTNQAGIAKKYFTREAAVTFQDELSGRLKNEGVTIHKTYICPHHQQHAGECKRIKPKTSLAEQAAKKFGVNLAESYFVGNKDTDIRSSAKTAKVRRSAS